ncbi:11975_t:CDS:2, partial [Funneliformis geosporum]
VPKHNTPHNKGYTLDDSIHASGSWADETEKDIVRHQNKYQPSQLDAILTQINNVSQQLADIHNNLAFTLTRVSMIEAVLNISSISPEQAKIINSNPLKDPIDEMDENGDQKDVVIAGIDTSKSTIRQQEVQTPIKNVSFQYDHMSTDDWSAFSHKSDTLFTSCQLVTLDKHKLKSKQALNFYWDLI